MTEEQKRAASCGALLEEFREVDAIYSEAMNDPAFGLASDGSSRRCRLLRLVTKWWARDWNIPEADPETGVTREAWVDAIAGELSQILEYRYRNVLRKAKRRHPEDDVETICDAANPCLSQEQLDEEIEYLNRCLDGVVYTYCEDGTSYETKTRRFDYGTPPEEEPESEEVMKDMTGERERLEDMCCKVIDKHGRNPMDGKCAVGGYAWYDQVKKEMQYSTTRLFYHAADQWLEGVGRNGASAAIVVKPGKKSLPVPPEPE